MNGVQADLGVWFPTVRTGTGAQTFTERLVAALQKRGIQAEITWLPHRSEFLPWTVAVPQPPQWARIVHINSWLPGRFVPDHLPVVATVHSVTHDPDLDAYKTLLQKIYHRAWVWRCERAALRRAYAATAVSQHAAAAARRALGRDDIIPIHNWIDTDLFCGDAREQQHTPMRLLFVGDATRRLKGGDLLLPIMSALGPDYELWYLGRTEDLGGGATKPSNIRALDRRLDERDMAQLYADCDVLLFPTRQEGFGLVALEAQSCGLPVVATDCSSLPEVVAHGETGWLCRLDDAQDFAAAIRRLREEPREWLAMRRAGRRRARELFSEGRAIEAYVALYRHVVESFNHRKQRHRIDSANGGGVS